MKSENGYQSLSGAKTDETPGRSPNRSPNRSQADRQRTGQSDEASSYSKERARRSLHGDAGRSAAAKEGTTSHRIQRVEREIRDVVGSYLISGFRGTLPGIVSITRVICSKDLRTSKIFVTVMGLSLDSADGQAVRDLAVEELQAHAFEVQREINVRLRMRHCPRVSFIYDEGFDNVMKVERILRELGEERERADTKAKAKVNVASELASLAASQPTTPPRSESQAAHTDLTESSRTTND